MNRRKIYHVKQYIGVCLFDVPRYLLWTLFSGREGWIRVRNRDEVVALESGRTGVRCPWQYSSALHAPRLVPWLGLLVYRRALWAHPIRLVESEFGNQWFSPCSRPDVSFVLGHHGRERLPNLLTTLRSVAAQVGAKVECIVVEMDGSPRSEGEVRSAGARYLHVQTPEYGGLYNRSRAFNEGAVVARGEVIVFHDGDLLIPIDYARTCLSLVRDCYEVINLKRFIFYLDKASSRHIVVKRNDLQRVVYGLGIEQIIQNSGAGGSVAVTKDAYYRLGGFDEDFVGWGGEDSEFWDRAQQCRVYDYGLLPLIHLWHKPQRGKRAVRGMGLYTRQLYLEKLSLSAEERTRECARRFEGRYLRDRVEQEI